jgi:hypothetical protein
MKRFDPTDKLTRLFLAVFFLICVAVFSAQAQAGTTLTFAWDQSTEAKGYHVYTSSTQTFTKTSTKVCTAILEPTRTCTVPNVPDGLMWYAATAYDSAGNESDFSVPISFNGDTIPPVKPGGFKITVTVTVNP